MGLGDSFNHAIETADAKTAQTLARHKTLELTMNVYGRVNTERVRSAVEKLGEEISIVESKRISQRDDRRALCRLPPMPRI